MESLEHHPQEAVPPTRDNPYGGQEARNMAYARTKSSQGQGGHAFLRAAPTDRAREIPSNEFVYATRRAFGVKEFLAERCPRCHRGREGEIITTVHARTCPRDGAQVNMNEPLKYALSRALNGLRVKHDVESGAPFTGERNLSMDIRPGAPRTHLLPGTATKEYSSMSHTQTRKHRYTCGTAARPAMESQPKHPRRESVSTTLVRDTCPLTNAALNLPP
ncbi:unnamed protein product [Ectocarpus sp. CCAP 1310/34]|nr:unnamed protein product [Ectocarpus sp. CCAP 1310/34]